MDLKDKIIEILDVNGIFIDNENLVYDIDLREYITDSIQFISFIVELEKLLDMEFPDEMILYDNLASLNGFSNIIEKYLSDVSINSNSTNELLTDYDPLEDDDYDEDDPYLDCYEGKADES